MTATRPRWAEGLAILRARHVRLPEAVLDAWSTPLDLSDAAKAIANARAVVTTGVGSSLAHARYLSWLLRTQSGIASWDVPTGSFLSSPGAEAKGQTLVVFSQGFSPNARLPIAHAKQYGAFVLVTAADADSPDRAQAVRAAREAGAIVVRMPVAPEYEVLLRILGPVIGYVVALRIAHAAGAPLDLSPAMGSTVCSAIREGSARMEDLLAIVDRRVFADPITFVASNGYAALSHNLCAKVLEGMFLAWPAAVDALELAHGSLQEASGKPRTFIALRRDAPHEEALFGRVRQTMEPQHRLIEMTARLDPPFAVLEHEAMMNVLLLGSIASRELDQVQWPGKGGDAPLYAVGAATDLTRPIPEAKTMEGGTTSRLIEDLSWTEIEGHLKAGRRTFVLPLGATEQHGPHMPLAVDTIIANALAERFCLRVPEALRTKAIAIGCSIEHLAFPGTLSYSEPTLIAMMGDILDSALRHGFDHIVIFSAHGGNDAPLAAAENALRARAGSAKLTVVHGIEQIGKTWQEASTRAGVPPFAAGHHAGEFETSILLALVPEAIRWPQVRPGTSGDVPDPQQMFYPSLRDHAPEGVVGDPSLASGERAEGYLSAWVDLILDAYRATLQRASTTTLPSTT